MAAWALDRRRLIQGHTLRSMVRGRAAIHRDELRTSVGMTSWQAYVPHRRQDHRRPSWQAFRYRRCRRCHNPC